MGLENVEFILLGYMFRNILNTLLLRNKRQLAIFPPAEKFSGVLTSCGSPAQDFLKVAEHAGSEVRREIWDKDNNIITIYMVVKRIAVKESQRKSERGLLIKLENIY